MPTIANKSLAIILLLIALSGCTRLEYYRQSVGGHMEILRKSRPVAELLGDGRTPPRLQKRLALAQEMRDFASDVLGLPDNDSYRRYADLGRPYALWNVFAAPALSVTPKEWCFPIIGCVAYRGYFFKGDAEAFAATLRRQGLDVYVAGVSAYSTLGWFDDPLLNTVIHQREGDLAGLIFHELAHQVVYVKGDTVFNESFATAVELEGAARWFKERGSGEKAAAYRRRKERDRRIVALLLQYRGRLEEVYGSEQPEAWKYGRKRRLLALLKQEYRRRSWQDLNTTGPWFAQDPNNAHLAAIGAYYQLLPAFRRLLARHGGDLGEFYKAVKRLGRLPRAERARRLQSLAEGTEDTKIMTLSKSTQREAGVIVTPKCP